MFYSWLLDWCVVRSSSVSSFGGFAIQLMFREALALNSMGLSCSTHWCSVCFLQHFGLAQVRTRSHQVGHQCCKFARCMFAGGHLVSYILQDFSSIVLAAGLQVVGGSTSTLFFSDRAYWKDRTTSWQVLKLKNLLRVI